MNIPNTITLSRLVLCNITIFFMFQDHWTLAFYLMIVSKAADLIDGSVARKYNQVTKEGKYIDMVVDVLIVIEYYLTVGYKLNIIFMICGLLMIQRELLRSSMRLFAAFHGKELSSKNWGKIKDILHWIPLIGVVLNHIYFKEHVQVNNLMNKLVIASIVYSYIVLILLFIQEKNLLRQRNIMT